MKSNLSVMLSALLISSVLFTGCGETASDTSSSGLTVTVGDGGQTLNIKWKRTGSVIYASHTDLVSSNSTNKPSRVAGTNSSDEVTISCNKGIYTGGLQIYFCKADNESLNTTLYLQDNETNYLEERGNYSSTDYGQKIIATITSNGSGSYTVAYK